VRYASIMTHPDGRSKGCAIVEFASPDEAGRAVEAFNDTEIEGRKILIREVR
jgi:RNA recognition motif-containing protein